MRKAETTIVANAVVNLIGVMNSETKYRQEKMSGIQSGQSDQSARAAVVAWRCG